MVKTIAGAIRWFISTKMFQFRKLSLTNMYAFIGMTWLAVVFYIAPRDDKKVQVSKDQEKAQNLRCKHKNQIKLRSFKSSEHIKYMSSSCILIHESYCEISFLLG